MGKMMCSTEYRWREDTPLSGNLQEHRKKSVVQVSMHKRAHTPTHMWRERERRVCTCMYRCTHTQHKAFLHKFTHKIKRIHLSLLERFA